MFVTILLSYAFIISIYHGIRSILYVNENKIEKSNHQFKLLGNKLFAVLFLLIVYSIIMVL